MVPPHPPPYPHLHPPHRCRRYPLLFIQNSPSLHHFAYPRSHGSLVPHLKLGGRSPNFRWIRQQLNHTRRHNTFWSHQYESL